MSDGDNSDTGHGDRQNRTIFVVAAALLCVIGLGVALVVGLLALRGSMIATGAYVVFLIAYGFGTIGTGLLLSALTSARRVERVKARPGMRGGGLSIAIDTPWPGVVFAAAAVLLLIIVLALRATLDSQRLTGAGVLVAAFIGWWSYRAFAGWRRRRNR